MARTFLQSHWVRYLVIGIMFPGLSEGLTFGETLFLGRSSHANNP